MKFFDRIVVFCLFLVQYSFGQNSSLNTLFELSSAHHTNFVFEKFDPLVYDWSGLDTVKIPSFKIDYGIGTDNFQNIDGLYQQAYKALKLGLKYNRRSLTYPLGQSLLLSNYFSGKFEITEDRILLNSNIQFYNHSRKEFGYLIDPDTIFPTQSLEIEFFEPLLNSSSSHIENSYIDLSPGYSLNSNQDLFITGSYSQRKRDFVSSERDDIINFPVQNDSSYTHDSYKNLIYNYGFKWLYQNNDKIISIGANRVLLEYRNSGNNLNFNGYQADLNISNQKNKLLLKYNSLGLLLGRIQHIDSISSKFILRSEVSYVNKELGPWLQNYYSNHVIWDNNSFNLTQRKISFQTSVAGRRIPTFKGDLNYFFENIYIDNERKLFSKKADWLLSFSVSDTLKIKKWKLIGENVLSFTNENSGIRFPLFKSNSWISYNFKIFKQKLELEPAVGINYFTEYRATWNDPITGYKILTDELIGGYPFLNVRLQAKIDRVYFGLKMTHVNEYTMGAHYIDFRTPGLNRLMIGFIRWQLAY